MLENPQISADDASEGIGKTSGGKDILRRDLKIRRRYVSRQDALSSGKMMIVHRLLEVRSRSYMTHSKMKLPNIADNLDRYFIGQASASLHGSWSSNIPPRLEWLLLIRAHIWLQASTE